MNFGNFGNNEAMMSQFQRLMSDPEFMSLLSDPSISSRLTQVYSLPQNQQAAAMMNLFKDPKFAPLLRKMQGGSGLGGLGSGSNFNPTSSNNYNNQPLSNLPASNPSNVAPDNLATIKQIPATFAEIVIYSEFQKSLVLSKINEFNGKISVSYQISSPNLIILIRDISQSNDTQLYQTHQDILIKLFHWPLEYLPPIMNIVRFLVLKPEHTVSFLHNFFSTSDHPFSQLCSHLNSIFFQNNNIVSTLLLRTFCNMCSHQSHLVEILSYFDHIMDFISPLLSSNNMNIQTQITILFFNYSLIFSQSSQDYSEKKIRLLLLLQEIALKYPQSNLIYRCVVAIGTLLYQDLEVITTAISLDLPQTISTVLSLHSSSDNKQCYQCCLEIMNLFSESL